jgi:hypothetical protein
VALTGVVHGSLHSACMQTVNTVVLSLDM